MLDVCAERWVVWWNVVLSQCTVWALDIGRVAGDGVVVECMKVSWGPVICSCVYEWCGSCVRWAVVQSRVVCGLLVTVAHLGVSISTFMTRSRELELCSGDDACPESLHLWEGGVPGPSGKPL